MNIEWHSRPLQDPCVRISPSGAGANAHRAFVPKDLDQETLHFVLSAPVAVETASA